MLVKRPTNSSRKSLFHLKIAHECHSMMQILACFSSPLLPTHPTALSKMLWAALKGWEALHLKPACSAQQAQRQRQAQYPQTWSQFLIQFISWLQTVFIKAVSVTIEIVLWGHEVMQWQCLCQRLSNEGDWPRKSWALVYFSCPCRFGSSATSMCCGRCVGGWVASVYGFSPCTVSVADASALPTMFSARQL